MSSLVPTYLKMGEYIVWEEKGVDNVGNQFKASNKSNKAIQVAMLVHK